jgi:hypothetical protein
VQARAGKTAVKTNPAGANINAIAGFLHVEQILRAISQNKPVKLALIGAAALVVIVMLGIPIRRAVVTQKTAALQKAALQHGAAHPGNTTAQQATSPASASAEVAKPRDSIVAEMNVENSIPAPEPPAPAAPVRTKTVPKAAPKAIALKARPLGNPTAQPVVATAAKQVVVSPAMLELAVEHQFKEATLSVWVDNELLLTRTLHGGSQKKLVVFKGIHGQETESLKLPSGTHQLHFRAQSADQTVDLSKTITGEFAPGDDKTLQISFDKHNTEMHLTWRVAAKQ